MPAIQNVKSSPTASKQPQTSQAQQNLLVPPAAMPLVAPAALLQAHLQSSPSIRPSGRQPLQSRRIDLNIGSLTYCNGSSVVKIGQTTIICGIRGETVPVSEIPSYNDSSAVSSSSTMTRTTAATTQKSERRLDYDPIAMYNLVVPNIDLSTGCSPAHAMNTAPLASTQALTQRLYSLLLSTRLLSSSDLEIRYTPPPETNYELDPDDPAYVAGAAVEQVKAFWVLYIDMVCISYGGEGVTFDAAWLAMLAALRTTLLPRAWWDGDEKLVLCDPDVAHGRRLQLDVMPVPLSLGVFERQNGLGQDVGRDQQTWWMLADLDAFEEECCQERACVVVDALAESKILRIEKFGGPILNGIQHIREIIILAQSRASEWIDVLDKALKSSQS